MQVSLSGQVLAVDGIPSKLAAAEDVGIEVLILPAGNRPVVEAMRPELRNGGVQLVFVETLREAAAVVMGSEAPEFA